MDHPEGARLFYEGLRGQLQALALNQGVQRHSKLWTAAGQVLEQLPLAPWAARRRTELLADLDELKQQIQQLDTGGGGTASRGDAVAPARASVR